MKFGIIGLKPKDTSLGANVTGRVGSSRRSLYRSKLFVIILLKSSRIKVHLSQFRLVIGSCCFQFGEPGSPHGWPRKLIVRLSCYANTSLSKFARHITMSYHTS